MKAFLKRYLPAIVITLLFAVFMTFFAPNNLLETRKLKNRIHEIQKETDIYRAKSTVDSTFLENLKDDEFLEKYARENFFMKRTGEEIYLIK